MPDGFLTAFSAVINALFLVGSVYIYLSLVRQISARSFASGETTEKTFALPDAVLALALATLFTVNAAGASASSGKVILRTTDLAANALVSLGLFAFVAAFLTLRGRKVNVLAGFSKLGFQRVFITGGILLFAAYPLIFLADLLTQRVFGEPSSRQGIVELFTDSQTLKQRVLIIVLAIAIAPMVEEFIFRFFLYGVVKRYFGRLAGLVGNSVLFAAVHAHLPSAAPLFVLGACFTVAYEWSGSILVSMTMHALFNSFTLVALAFPELFQQ
ncbi:MAG: CPBP family intramembrane metalloprotease [Chthoniobacterales bacterium]|nr:CPBP family intramembrane metalloprotease [Chthoniobacterales bacterium]